MCPLGSLWTGKDVKTGATIKIYMKKWCNPYGTFNFVSESGLEAFLLAMDVPAAGVKAVVAENNFSMTLTEVEGGAVHYVLRSKVQPMDMTLVWGEEYEMEWPVMPGTKFSAITTLSGDKLVTVTKGPMGTFTSTCKMGKTFCTVVSEGERKRLLFSNGFYKHKLETS